MILTAFRRNSPQRNIHALYGMIVAQARSPVFYSDYGVPDTVQGRFELIVLHLVLLFDRLSRNNEADRGAGPGRSRAGLGDDLGQRLFDVFCRDLDENLREMGIGDMAVPREMRRFGEAFYGRQAAYRAAIAATGERELEKALARNIFGVVGVDHKVVRLARYARAAANKLDTEEEQAIAAGKAVFPRPEAFSHA
jgi:cytochrome b pre-mRNA-processing protein 3